MNKQWFMSLALALGVFGPNVFGQYSGNQYPGYQSNGQGQYQIAPRPGFRPNGAQSPSFQYPGNEYIGSQNGSNSFGASAYPVPTQSVLQSVPQVPLGLNSYGPSMGGQVASGPGPMSFGGQAYGNASPVAGQYHLVTTQDQTYAQPGAEAVPAPVTPYQSPQYPNSQYSNQQYPNQQYPNQQYSNSQYSGQMATPPQPLLNEENGGASPLTSVAPYSAGCQTCAPAPQSYFPSTSPSVGYGFLPNSVAPNCVSCGPAPISTTYAAPARSPFLCGLPACVRPWYFRANFLLFNRVDCDDTPLSFVDTSYTGDVLTTKDARMQSAPGFEIHAGRYFNCGRNAIEFGYWGIYPNTETVTRARPTAGDYRSRMPFAYIMMPGTPAAPATPYAAYDWYDNAFTHALTRSSEYYSFEVNLLGFGAGCAAKNFNCASRNIFGGHGCGSCGGSGCTDCASGCGPACNTCAPPKFATGPCCLIPPSCGSRLNLTWLAGFRYFVFNDNLLYGASLNDSVVNRANDDLYYEVCTTNELAGFQTGCRLDCCLHKCVNLYGSTNVGIYNNHSTLYSFIGTDYQHAYLDDTRTPTNPHNGSNYAFSEMTDQVAFLSEIGAGLGFRFSCCWSATAGYRAIIASGVATAPGNLQNQFANYDHIRDFDNCGTLVLHGFNVGATYNF